MGRKLEEEKDVKEALHWLKELTGITNVEDAIILGFHRIPECGEWSKEQRTLTELRDLYLLKLDGRVTMDLNQLYATA